MITILKNLWYSREARKKELCDKLEEEQRKLDLEIETEDNSSNVEPTSSLKNVIQQHSDTIVGDNGGESENLKCYKRTGK